MTLNKKTIKANILKVALTISVFTISLFASAQQNTVNAASTLCVGSGVGCYATVQDAVDAAVDGDTIELNSNVAISQQITFDSTKTNIVLNGNNHTINPTFTKTSNSNNSSIGIIAASNITINDLTIDGASGTNLHGINLYHSTGIFLNNVTLSNNNAGLIVNSSTVTLNNISTFSNGWYGINVDLTGSPLVPASLTITGTSTHSDLPIFIDTPAYVTSGQITLNIPKYETLGGGVYTLKDLTAPTVSNIKMYVNGVESTYMRAGDTVTITATVTDDQSGVNPSKVRLLARSIVTTDGGYIDSGYFVNTTGDTYQRTFTFPADGKYVDTHKVITNTEDGLRFYIKAFDNAGNYTNSTAKTFSYDNIVPLMNSIKMYVSKDGITYSEGSVVNIGDYVRIDVNTSDVTSGIKDVEFRITNKLGGYVAPRTYVSTPISTDTYRFEFQIPADAKYIDTHANITEGINDHIFWARTTDNVGNYNHGIRGEFTFDKTAPSAPINGLPNGTILNTNEFDFTWDASSDTNAPLTYVFVSSKNPAQVGGVLTTGLWTSGTLTSNMIHSSGASDGTWYWQVKAIDPAGNESDWSEIWNVTLDTEKPTVSNLHFENTDSNTLSCGTITNIQNVKVAWDGSDNVGGTGIDHYNYYITRIESGVEKVWQTTKNTAYHTGDMTYGLHKVKVQAVDAAGNSSDWTDLCEITYDNIAPEVYITNPANADTISGEVDVRGTVIDDNPDHYYYVIKDSLGNKIAEATPNQTATFIDETIYTWDTRTVKNGTYTIKLAARDAADNKHPTKSVKTIILTVYNPLPTITHVDPATLNEGDYFPTVSVTATDDLAMEKVCVEMTLDTDPAYNWSDCDYFVDGKDSHTYDVNDLFGLASQVWVNPSPKFSSTSMPEGSYTFTYWVVDQVGNESIHQTTVYTLNNLAPTLPVNTTTTLASRAVKMTASPSNGNAPYTYVWTDGNFAGCSGTSNSVTTPTTAGTYNCKVIVTDFDGDSIERNMNATVQPATTYYSYVPVVTTQEETPEEETTEETEEPTDDEVLGARVCEETKALSGKVFIDANGDGKYTEGEEYISGVKVTLSYTVDGEVYEVAKLTSDENGVWTSDVCPGEYTVTVDVSTLPEQTSLDEAEITINVSESEENTDFAILLTQEEAEKETNYMWLFILLGVFLVAIVAYLLYRWRNLNK